MKKSTGLATLSLITMFSLSSCTDTNLTPLTGNNESFTQSTSVQKASGFLVQVVNGVNVVIPDIGNGKNVLAVLNSGKSIESVSANLRTAFGSPASAKAVQIQPESKAEMELASQNPGATIVSLNPLLPPAVSALFNREPNFAGPNCFNAAFTAAGMMQEKKLRHVGNPETDQLLSMYFKKIPSNNLQAGDIVVLNGGDHGVFYLGGGLIFHKKSYLKQHIYRIVPFERAYEPEPNEWKPGPFDNGSPFNSSEPIREKEAWRPTGAKYNLGTVSADERAKVDTILFIAGNVEKQAPNWSLSKELGYFTETLLENLVSEWSSMDKSSNPMIKAYYNQLSSFRDQANQSIEVELLSTPYGQSHATELLKNVWLPRNEYSKGLISQLLKIYGHEPADTEKVLDAIGRDFDRSPLVHIKSGQ